LVEPVSLNSKKKEIYDPKRDTLVTQNHMEVVMATNLLLEGVNVVY
jgi:hypothetical protein